LQRVFNGPLNEKWSKLPDLSPAEMCHGHACLALMFALGIYPHSCWLYQQLRGENGAEPQLLTHARLTIYISFSVWQC